MKKSITKHLNKFQSKYFHWKQEIREKIDRPMLKVIYPMGRVLRRVYTEKWEGEGTLGRQVGTYPITCYVPKKLPLHRYHDLIVVNHGFRSLVCLKSPVELTNLSQKELEAVDGIGKKRAQAIQAQNPKTEDDWKEMEPEIQLTRQKLTRK